MAGQIEECYLDHENALKAAIFVQSHGAYCLKNNYSVRNSAKISGYSISTVQRIKKMFDIKSSRDPDMVNEKNETVSDVVLF